MNYNIISHFACTAVVTFFALPSLAQTVPAGAEAGRIDNRFVDTSAPTSQITTVRGLESTIPPSQAAAIKLKLNGVIIAGSSVYLSDALTPTYSELLGKTVTLTQIFDIAAAITAKYGQDGYILSRAIIPPQDLNQGGATIRIEVIEGYVDDVRWPDKTAASRRVLDGYENNITSNRPLNIKTLERNLLLANDIPGSQFQSNLVASESNRGASALVVTVEEDNASGYVSVDNYGVEASGPYQLTFGGALNNYLGFNEQFKADVTLAGPSEAGGSELQYLSFGYSQILNSDGLRFFVNGNISRGQPGTPALVALEYETEGMNVSTGISHSFIRTREMSLTGTIAFDARNSQSFNLGVPATEDRLRIIRGELAFENADENGGQNQITASFSKGVEGLGSTENGNLLASRTPGTVDFFRVNADLARTQQLSNGFSLYGHLSGQWTEDPLLSSQECGYGGRTFGGGYDSSIITGDLCAMASLELRKNMAVPEAMSEWLDYTQPFAFVDYGKVWNIDAPLGTPEEDFGSSAGLGMRIGSGDFSAELAVTKTLQKPESQPDVTDTRVWLKATMKF